MRPLVPLLCAVCIACPSNPEPDPEPEPTEGLPEGASTWSGSLEVGGFRFEAELVLDNDAGDLEGELTFRDDPDEPAGFGEGTFGISGAHDPSSGAFAFAPRSWLSAPATPSELLGAEGGYDRESSTISGTVVDYAGPSFPANELAGGPLELTLDSGDGDPTTVGDGGQSLPSGESTFLGTMQCTGPEREVELVIDYDDAGSFAGAMTVGDPSLATPLGTFSVSGAHNPSSGRIVVVPGVWEQLGTTLTFFVVGEFDAGSGEFDGDQQTDTDVCPRGTWHVTLQG